jgi:hypothetical protein
MSQTAYCSMVFDRSAPEVWNIVRNFKGYPTWINGVEERYIEPASTHQQATTVVFARRGRSAATLPSPRPIGARIDPAGPDRHVRDAE